MFFKAGKEEANGEVRCEESPASRSRNFSYLSPCDPLHLVCIFREVSTPLPHSIRDEASNFPYLPSSQSISSSSERWVMLRT